MSPVVDTEVEVMLDNAVVEVLPAASTQVVTPKATLATTVEIVTTGPQGPRGPAGTLDDVILNEIPSGDINGSNDVFTTAADFTKLWVFLNGVRQVEGDDYTITGSNEFTYLSPPLTGMSLRVDYVQA